MNPAPSKLSQAEIIDLMARQSLDIALDELGIPECLRIIAERADLAHQPRLRPA